MTTDNTFFDGNFSTGTRRPRKVVDRDYPCEYSLVDYLAAATAGQEVAVGQLILSELMTREKYEQTWPGLSWKPGIQAFTNYEIDLLAIPGVGIWVCEPVFSSAAKAHPRLTTQLEVVERTLDRPLADLPIEPALIHILDDVAPDLTGIELSLFYDTATFENVTETLANRRSHNHPPATVDTTLHNLLDAGEWLDSKEYDPNMDWPIPRWLADLTQTPVAA